VALATFTLWFFAQRVAVAAGCGAAPVCDRCARRELGHDLEASFFPSGERSFHPWISASVRSAQPSTVVRRLMKKSTAGRGGRPGLAAPPGAPADPHVAWVRKSWERIRPFSTGGNYVNFQLADDAARTADAYGANYQRLQRIKATYDPNNLFRVNHNIPPAAGPQTVSCSRPRGARARSPNDDETTVRMQHKVGEPSRRPAGDGTGKRLLAGRPVGEGPPKPGNHARSSPPWPPQASPARSSSQWLPWCRGCSGRATASWPIRSWRWWPDPAAGCRT
jgi:hypothetical protein